MADLYFVTLVQKNENQEPEQQVVQILADYLTIQADSKLYLSNVADETDYAFGKNRWVTVSKGLPLEDDGTLLTIHVDDDSYSVSQFSVDSTTGALMLNQSTQEVVDGEIKQNVIYFKMINGLHWNELKGLSHVSSEAEK